MITEEVTAPAAETTLRDRAVSRLKKRHDFHAHLLVYTLVNGFVVVIWLVTSSPGYFWPIFLIGFWGIGLVMNAWDVYRGDAFDEETIRREMARLRRER
jgi:hypothetical protein